jgi:hypothetical protein
VSGHPFRPNPRSNRILIREEIGSLSLRASGRNSRFDEARRTREQKVVIGKVAAGVDLRRPPTSTEDPMTDDRMALVELLQRSGEADREDDRIDLIFLVVGVDAVRYDDLDRRLAQIDQRDVDADRTPVVTARSVEPTMSPRTSSFPRTRSGNRSPDRFASSTKDRSRFANEDPAR